MLLTTPTIWKILFTLFFVLETESVEVTLSTTEGATTDLGWNVHNRNEMPGFSGWEEQSIPLKEGAVRGYLICPLDYNPNVKDKPQSWLLLPQINVDGASRIFIEMNFTMRVCKDMDKTCRETFSVYFRRTEGCVSEVAEAENLNPMNYTKIDTVAAEVRFLKADDAAADDLVNRETVSISIDNPTSNTVLHIAIVDVGACMALMNVRVYHKVCPQVVTGLAVFKETKTGSSDTALVSVAGTCVQNAAFPEPTSASPENALPHATFEPDSGDVIGPLYHCTSSGEWQVQTGQCQCLSGHQPTSDNAACEPCLTGSYKSGMGNHRCAPCPKHSITAGVGADSCQCDAGYYTTDKESSDESSAGSIPHLFFGNINNCELCSKLPSPPLPEIETESDPGSLKLSWQRPSDDGGCGVVKYCVLCEARSSTIKDSFSCDHLTFSSSPCDLDVRELSVSDLRGHVTYNFTVVSYTSVTKQRFSSALAQIFQLAGQKFGNSTAPSGQGSTISKETQALLDTSGSLLFHRTGDTLPSSVRDVTFNFGNQTTIAVTWEEPVQKNGEILYYEVRWKILDDEEPEEHSPGRRVSAWRSTSVNSTKVLLTQLYPGSNYQVVVYAHNSAGSDNGSIPLSAATSPQEEPTEGLPVGPDNRPFVIATIAIAVLVVIIICIIAALQWKCRLFKGKKHKQSNGHTITHAEFRPYDSQHATMAQRTYVDPFSLAVAPHHRFLCETSAESITCEAVIGVGEFGEVYSGTLATIDLKTGQETTIQVAVKQLRDQCEPQEQVNFLREANFLEKFRHPNIVHLEAVVTSSRPFFIVTELMDHGSLLGHLTKLREKAEAEANGRGWTPPLPPKTIAKMLRGVASGMEYLCGRGFVHRDLAARNVLINSDLVCKVADFGLTREVESDDTQDGSNGSGTYTTMGGKIAIRWTAPEAMAFRTYTQYSDVWSFGILTWEATSFGEKPYWDLTNHEVLKAVNDGFRLPAPDKCPAVLHKMMLDCWQHDRNKRPNFTELINAFDRIISNENVLEVPASPASCGADTFFPESDNPDARTSPLDSDSNVSEPLLTTVMVDRHNINLRSASEDTLGSYGLNNADDEGSEISSCTSTICASEVTVCAANGAVIYVPLCRSDSEEARADSPIVRASPVF